MVLTQRCTTWGTVKTQDAESRSISNRDEGGRFAEKVTKQDILKVFDAADDPVLSASEIAEEFGVARQTITRHLNDMKKEGLVERKEMGARSVAWWATVAPALSPEAAARADAADRESAVSLSELEDEFAEEAD